MDQPLRIILITLLLPITLWSQASTAQPDELPFFDGDIEDLSGIWSPDCSDPSSYFGFFNSAGVMSISPEDNEVYYAAFEESWLQELDVQLSISEGELTWAITYDQGTENFVDEKCSSLPPALTPLHGEAETFFFAMDDMALACETSPEECATVVLETLDVAGTGGLNEADVARLIRIGSYFAVLDNESQSATFEELLGGQALAIALAPTVASVLIRNFDYDGDGQLSAAELSTDRNLFDADTVAPAAGAAGDFEERIRENLEQLQQMLQFLQ